MDIDELFSKQLIVQTKYNGVDVFHHLREATTQEDIEYSRILATTRVRFSNDMKTREVITTDAALQAPVNFYDTICQKVVVENGAGPQEVPDFKTKIPRDLKIAVVNAYQQRISVRDKDDLGNSRGS